MAIVFYQQRKIQKNLIFIFIAVILIIIFVIWQGFFKEEKITPLEEIILLPPKKEIKIDFNILKNPILEKLQPFSEIQPFKEIPPEKGKPGEVLGRENPFLPY